MVASDSSESTHLTWSWGPKSNPKLPLIDVSLDHVAPGGSLKKPDSGLIIVVYQSTQTSYDE